jgi:hypothetical protein
MNPQKLREELQNKTIKPSPGSWEKLNGKLSAYENNNKGSNWLFLKVAAVILVFISAGFYFSKQQEEIINTPIIVSPTPKEIFKKIPVADDVIETEVTATPSPSTSTRKTIIKPEARGENLQVVALVEPDNTIENSVIKNTDEVLADTEIKEVTIAGLIASEEQLIDDEIDQLLYKSKIKLIVNGEISSKKLVNSNALLNSVEDDLDKDLKQLLLEKIVNTIKKEKEVVTSKEN